MKKTAKYDPCLAPDCQEEGTARGLCDKHYRSAGQWLKKREKKWADLEKAGLCLPARRGKGTKSWVEMAMEKEGVSTSG